MPEYYEPDAGNYSRMRRMPIAAWQTEVHENNRVHGFYDNTSDPENIDRKLMLAVGELAEAQEELRSGRAFTEVYYSHPDTNPKPEGFGIELADAVIRILDLAEYCGIDLAALMAEKHLFNVKRPYKHGRNF